MKIMLCLIVAMIIAIQVFAQVATLSLDPSQTVSLPSVTSWRYYNTLAITYGSGSYESDYFDGDFIMTGGIIALNLGGFGLEVYTQTFSFDGGSTDGSDEMSQVGTTTQLGISYLFGDFISVGVGQISIAEDMEFDNSGTINTEDKDDTAMMISGNVILGEVFFLGMGINSYSRTVNGNGSGTEYERRDLDWQEMVMGVGILTGKPGDFQFKAEFYTVSSPEVTAGADGAVLANGHKKSVSSVSKAEVKTGLYFFGYSSTTTKESEIDSTYVNNRNEETTSISTNISLGYINDEGFLFTIYSDTMKETSNGEDEAIMSTIGIYIGYNF